MKALIIDDDIESRNNLEGILSTFFKCDVVESSQNGISKFKESLDAKKPYKLVLLDMGVSEGDNHELLKIIRENEKTEDIRRADWSKVIMVSKPIDNDTVSDSFKEGCDSHVIKPINKDEVIHRIRDLGLIE